MRFRALRVTETSGCGRSFSYELPNNIVKKSKISSSMDLLHRKKSRKTSRLTQPAFETAETYDRLLITITYLQKNASRICELSVSHCEAFAPVTRQCGF